MAALHSEQIFQRYPDLNAEDKLVIAQVEKIGQAERVFKGFEDREKFRDLLDKLVAVYRFYREIGGIVGYQSKVLELMRGSKEQRFCDAKFHSPSFVDISNENGAVHEAISWGIEALNQIAEIYPLGGAADRLHLVEEKTGKELPAAKLPFLGKTLLELLIRDLRAREYLYYQKMGLQVTIPIAIMTSQEKNNHAHVMEIFETSQFFGRPKDSVRFFTQPLVPAITADGDWCMAGILQPVLKPGGHGAIWKLARDEGIFEWFRSLGKTKCLVRQINNPISGLDYGLLAFTGIGCKNKMHFGFASAPRLLKAAEGVNVLIEKGSTIVLSNIEYCDFDKFGIEDRPLVEGEPYSRFSSNTNILFADLEAVSQAVKECPFPGLLINMKKGSYSTTSGEKKEQTMARLESTMQNIADVFVEKRGDDLKTKKTFVTYNTRHKTISTAKKVYSQTQDPAQDLVASIRETPENCFYDLLLAARELLTSCGFELPPKRSVEEHLELGPEFAFLYHPALGPLYSILRNKLQGGTLKAGSEWILELSDCSIKNLQVDGSLQIIASRPMGHLDRDGQLHFSDQRGSCVLENVTVENAGVQWKKSQPFWKMALQREETTRIILKGRSRFVARDLHFKGNQTFIVEDGETVEL